MATRITSDINAINMYVLYHKTLKLNKGVSRQELLKALSEVTISTIH